MDAERDRTDPVDLAGLPRELAPPRGLEERTVSALRSHRLLDSAPIRRALMLRVAAAITL